jgi:hypothetical protein
MRLVVWNCARGVQKKWSTIEDLHPDVAVVPQCAHPDRLVGRGFGSSVWTGRNVTNGLGVFGFGDWTVSAKLTHETRLHDVLPVRVDGPAELDMFAVWAHNRRAVDHVPGFEKVPQPTALLDVYKIGPVRERPLVVCGDFNNGAVWDTERRAPFAHLVERYRIAGLSSLYHASTGEAFGAESMPTHWWRNRSATGPTYHIDYVFVSDDVVAESSLRVGTFDESVTKGLSDHAFLVADIAVDTTS